MSSTVTFYIVRHGKTLLNTLDKVQGWCDSPLTPQGAEVAECLGVGMGDIVFDSVYTSDLRRTRQTAEIMLKAKGQEKLPITEVWGFREACFGGYESDYNLKMWNDVSLFLGYTRYEDMYAALFSRKIKNEDVLDGISKLDRMGLAESFKQVENRTQKALKDVAIKESSDSKDKNILVVAHGMSIIAMLQNLGGGELLKSHLENASVSKVIYRDGWFTVLSMGDMTYVNNGIKINELTK